MQNVSRRHFGKLALAASASMIPGRVLGANNKVNIAFIGCGAQGGSDAMNMVRTGMVNVVALCDVQFGTKHTAKLEAEFPGVPRFTDFRKMFDKVGNEIDAVTVGTPDHSHFPAAMLAMSQGKHVFVEKPLAHTYEECALLMKAEEKTGVVCQMGNQGHSGPNYFQFKAWTEAGVIKDVTEIIAYMNRPRRWHGWEIDGFPKGGKIPEGMDWNAWIASAVYNDFNKKLHPGNWRSWFDYGMGAFGDWGPHILDTAHEFLDLGMPEKVTAVKRDGANEFIFPQASTIQFDFPARGEKPPVKVTWYDGQNNKPPHPSELPEGKRLEACGKIIRGKDLAFKGGTHGSVLRVIPEEKMREMGKDLPRVSGKNSNHYLNFIRSIQGEEKTRSPFRVAAPLTQVFNLGVISQRLGGSFTFDRAAGTITDNDVAKGLLTGPPPRKGWEEFYRI